MRYSYKYEMRISLLHLVKIRQGETKYVYNTLRHAYCNTHEDTLSLSGCAHVWKYVLCNKIRTYCTTRHVLQYAPIHNKIRVTYFTTCENTYDVFQYVKKYAWCILIRLQKILAYHDTCSPREYVLNTRVIHLTYCMRLAKLAMYQDTWKFFETYLITYRDTWGPY